MTQVLSSQQIFHSFTTTQTNDFYLFHSSQLTTFFFIAHNNFFEVHITNKRTLSTMVHSTLLQELIRLLINCVYLMVVLYT
jgi:hypothetical protein